MTLTIFHSPQSSYFVIQINFIISPFPFLFCLILDLRMKYLILITLSLYYYYQFIFKVRILTANLYLAPLPSNYLFYLQFILSNHHIGSFKMMNRLLID